MTNITRLNDAVTAKNDESEDVPEHLQGLPPEVIKQLSTRFKKNGRGAVGEGALFEKIQTLFAESCDPVTLDEILIGLYRKWELLISRNALSAHMIRLEKKGLIKRPNNQTYCLPTDPR